MNDIENSDLSDRLAEQDRVLAELRAERARLRVAMDTGLPVGLLGNAATEEQARAIAGQMIAWKESQAPAAPPAPAPSYSVPQYGRNVLPHLAPGEVMDAYRGGKLQEACGLPPGSQNGRR